MKTMFRLPYEKCESAYSMMNFRHLLRINGGKQNHEKWTLVGFIDLLRINEGQQQEQDLTLGEYFFYVVWWLLHGKEICQRLI